MHSLSERMRQFPPTRRLRVNMSEKCSGWGPMSIRRAALPLKAAISALILAISVTGAVAGPLEDAEAAFRHGNYGTAMRISRPLADKGDARFQFLLGEMYQHGWGTPQDYAAA